VKRSLHILTVLLLAAALVAAGGQGKPKADPLEEWLGGGEKVPVDPDEAVEGGTNPFGPSPPKSSRPDALPGVVQLSNGKVLPGWLYTTREKPWLVYVEAEKRWRQIPFLTVLSIEAVVVEEKMELYWRWKATGEPERVYTGQRYPTRRLRWRFHLIDDSTVVGDVKGQPLWIETGGVKSPPMILAERSKGAPGQTLKDLLYLKKIFVSRRLMEAVIEEKKNVKNKKDEK